VDAPLFDQDLGFAQGVEQLAIQQFIPEPGIDGNGGAKLGHGSGGIVSLRAE
jgi:hypothetical protein